MQAHDKRVKFRAILAGQRCVTAGSVWDPISARIADRLGVDVGLMGGSLGSYAVLGAPDLIVLTLTEFADQARRICRASALPLMVDADHGYGNALNVMRTVHELESAGVAAMSIEDTELPRAFAAPEPRLLAPEEGVGKVRAALAARTDPETVILARTGAAAITGIEDAIARARAYCAAGADGLFLTGVTSRVQLDALASVASVPLVLGALSGELADRKYLAARGVRIALQGHLPFQAAVQALYATLKALREGAAPRDIANVAPAAMMRRLTREDLYDAASRDFLGG